MQPRKTWLLALTGWSFAVIGIGGLFLHLWFDAKNASYVSKVDGLVKVLAPQISKWDKEPRLAIGPFTDYFGRKPQLGLFLSDYLTASLRRGLPGVRIVDRSNLGDLFNEMKLLSEGLIDPSTAPQLGKLEAAKAIVVGRIDLDEGNIALNVKIVDIETARTIASEDVAMIATKRMQRLWQETLPTSKSARTEQEVIRQQRQASGHSEKDTFISLAIDFFIKNWPWIWTVLLVPISTWLITKFRRRKKKAIADAEDKKAA